MDRALPRPEHAIACLKDDVPGRCVWLVHRPDQAMRVIKQWATRPALLAKFIARVSSPHRQFQGADRSRRAGVETVVLAGPPRMIRRDGRRLIELEYDYVEGVEVMELVRGGELAEDEARRIGAACGRIVARYAGAGFLHRDLKLSNVVRVAAGGGVLVIDTNWVRPEPRPAVATARMLERLDVEPRDQGLTVPAPARLAATRAALRPLTRACRREVVQRLRARRLR